MKGEMATRLQRTRHLAAVLALLFVMLSHSPLSQAQAADVSDNQVNAVAQKLYCPVCENIPLDECQTVTCIDWKEEIRTQLAAGNDAVSVIDSFVRRFGDSVVGIPQDPVLRALTLLAPIVAALFFVLIGVATFRRFSRNRGEPVADALPPEAATEADYRARIEADLKARQ